MRGFGALLVALTACTEHGQAPAVQINIDLSGRIRQTQDGDAVGAAIDDPFTATLCYLSDATDTGEGATDSAFYRYDRAPSRISVTINDNIFETDPTAVSLLINVVDRSDDDAIVFRSETNRCSACPSISELSWQLDDFSSTAFDGVELPDSLDVRQFTQPFGLTISGGGTPSGMWMIRGTVETAARR